MVKVDIQFRYILKDARFKCTCGLVTTVFANNDKDGAIIPDSKCMKCGALLKMPHHYRDTYHNKTLRVVENEK